MLGVSVFAGSWYASYDYLAIAGAKKQAQSIILVGRTHTQVLRT